MSRRFDLEGKVIIITGAGQGIGRAFARAFATEGAVAVIAERNGVAARAVAGEITASGGQALALETDVANPESIAQMVSAVHTRFGRIDVLINNAGIFSTIKMRPFTEIPLDEWDEVMRVNVTGPFLMTRAVAPHMQRRKYGRIINIASAAVTMGRPGYLHYIASKAALIGMSRSLARELGPYGITVNSMLPGATDTEIERATVTPAQKQAMIAMRCVSREETPDDLVGTALFLASGESAFLTGQSITIDGGLTHL